MGDTADGEGLNPSLIPLPGQGVPALPGFAGLSVWDLGGICAAGAPWLLFPASPAKLEAWKGAGSVRVGIITRQSPFSGRKGPFGMGWAMCLLSELDVGAMSLLSSKPFVSGAYWGSSRAQ